MATIKGIEVQINGNATALSEALKGVNRNLEATQSALNAVTKQLKFDPSNTELLTNKQKLLSQQIENTQEKLKSLKDVEAEVKKQFNENKIGLENYSNFQNELSATKKSLENLQKQAIELANIGFAQLGETLDKVGGKMTNIGNKLSPISTAVGATGVAITKMASDFEDSLAKVETIADTSAVSMETLKAQIVELSNESGIAVADIANNVYDALSSGQETANAVDFVRNATMLATSGFTESSKSLDLLSTIMNAYKLEAEEVTKVSDILIKTQDLGKTTIDELSGSMGRIIPTAYNAHVSLEQVATGYAIMTANGIATAETTTYMSGMLEELNKSSSKVAKTLKEETGKTFSELMDEGYSLADCLEIINGSAEEQGLKFSDLWSSQTAVRSALTLLGDGAENFNNTLVEMSNSTGATAHAYEILQTPSEKLEKAINALKNAFLDLGYKLTPVIEKVAEIITVITEKIGSLDEAQQQMILIVGAVLTALAPVLIIGGKLISGLGSLVSGIGVAKGAITMLATTLGVPLAPMVAIIASFGAVVAAIIALWNTNEDFRKDMIVIWEALTSTITAILTPFVETIKVLISGALDFVRGAVQVFSALLTGDWQGLWNGILGIFNTIWNTITTALPTLIQGLINVFNGFMTDFLNIGRKLFDSVWDGMKGIWSDISSWVSSKVSWLADKLAFWRKGNAEMSSGGGDDDVDGSHANGLSYVPFDNYVAKLHKGERVLTAQENKSYSQGKGGQSTLNVTQNIYAPTDSPRDMEREARRELVKLAWEV